MEFRGVEFTIVKAIDCHKWRWRVAIPDLGNRTGLAQTKERAIAGAHRAIGWLLAAKKRKQGTMDDASD